MSVTVPSPHPLDAPFHAAYAADPAAQGLELGFTGFDTAAPEPFPRRLSAWIPGDQPAERLARLRAWKQQGRQFRYFFPERYYAPAAAAHRLFTRGHIGSPIHLLVKVQAHPATLLHPDAFHAPDAWLREPVLNRLALAIWMQGPVADVRVVSSQLAGAAVRLVLLRHTAPARQSILELSVSPDLFDGAEPAIWDRFEATGGDGFIRVTGLWREAMHAPRLEVHRGALDLVQRDLPRDFAQVYAGAAARFGRDAKARSFKLAEDYLECCLKIAGRGGEG